MKTIITMMVAVAGIAAAELTSFSFQGGKLYYNNGVAVPAGTYTDAAIVMLVDLNQAVVGGQLDIADIPAPYATVDLMVGPTFAGGKYSTASIEEYPATIAGQMVWLVVDLNGGGITVDDIFFDLRIGIAASGDMVNALTPPVGAGDVQVFNPGDITVGIPEASTASTMLLIGGLICLRRRLFAG